MAKHQLGKFKIEITVHARQVADDEIATAIKTSLVAIENSKGEDLHKYERPIDVPNDDDRDLINSAIAANEAINDFLRVALGGAITPRLANMMKAIVKDVESGKVEIDRIDKGSKPNNVPDSILNSPADLDAFLKDNQDNIDFDEIPDEFKNLFRGLGLDA